MREVQPGSERRLMGQLRFVVPETPNPFQTHDGQRNQAPHALSLGCRLQLSGHFREEHGGLGALRGAGVGGVDDHVDALQRFPQPDTGAHVHSRSPAEGPQVVTGLASRLHHVPPDRSRLPLAQWHVPRRHALSRRRSDFATRFF